MKTIIIEIGLLDLGGAYYEDKLVGDTLMLGDVQLKLTVVVTKLNAYEDFGLTLTAQHRFRMSPYDPAGSHTPSTQMRKV